MSVGGFDFELNGVKYNAAEDAQGDHYTVVGEPLRPPNAVTVIGENTQKFQMRPDTLQWTITDWSGGEGQHKYDNQAPNRHRELQGVRVFQKPGTLRPGYYVEDCQDSSGAADLVKDGILVIGIEALYLLDYDSRNAYLWDDSAKKFGAAISHASGVSGSRFRAAGDETLLFWLETATQTVWSWDGSGAPTAISLGTVDSNDTFLAGMGPNVYGFSPKQGKVWEIAKAGGSTVLIDDFSSETGPNRKSPITELDGRIYVAVSLFDRSMIREITPTTAAGTGFGAEIARIPGFTVQSIWGHSGILYMAGTTGDKSVVLYLVPGGAYGTLGLVRVKVGSISGMAAGGQMLEHFFVSNHLSASDSQTGVWEVDSVSGGFALLGIDEDGNAKAENIRSVVVFNDQIFASHVEAAGNRRVIRAYPDGFTKTSFAISPWHDFGLADEKILSVLVLSMEAMPANWTVNVDFAVNGSSSWQQHIIQTATNSTGERAVVSSDSSTAKFNTLAIRIRMTYTGGGVPTSSPVILGIDVLALVARPVKVWRIILDLSDDRSGGQGHSGAQKLANIETAVALQKVLDFKDGYKSQTPGVFSTNDVIIDSFVVSLSHPGEGTVAVTLKEVA